MRHGISKNSVKGRNLQAAYVDGLTLGNFFAFNQGLNKMGDQALPFKIHPEHFVFAGVHGGQEVMELIGEYGQPTYQKIFISLDAETQSFLILLLSCPIQALISRCMACTSSK